MTTFSSGANNLKVTINTNPIDPSTIQAIASNDAEISGLIAATGTYARTGQGVKFNQVTGSYIDIDRTAFIGGDGHSGKIELAGPGPVKYTFLTHNDGFRLTDEDYGITMIDIPHPFIADDGERNVITLDSTRVQKNFLATGGMYHGDTNVGPQYGFGGGSDLHLKTSGIRRMAITKESGNVGIGTSFPDAKLHVSGNTKLSGNVEVIDGDTTLYKTLNIFPPQGRAITARSTNSNNPGIQVIFEGPTTVGHDLFQKAGFTNGFSDNSNHFHAITDINRIEQAPEGDVKNLQRVQERYYAITDNNLPNSNAAFWAWHRVARTISSSTIDTSSGSLNVTGLQGSPNRLADSQKPFRFNTSPVGKSEEIIITLSGGHTFNTGDNVKMIFNQSFEGPIVAAGLFGKVASHSSTTLNVELYGGNYKTTTEVPSGMTQTGLSFDHVTLQAVGTGTIVQNGKEVNLQHYSKTNFTPNRLRDNTIKATWSGDHGLKKNETLMIITDGRGDLEIKQGGYVIDPAPNGDVNSAVIAYGRRIDTIDLSGFTSFGSSNWSIHKGSIDGIHDDTLGDNLWNFNANNVGEYKQYQIGPGCETDADCISIGRNVYNKESGTIKIGYENEILNITSSGIDVTGDVKANTLNVTGSTILQGNTILSGDVTLSGGASLNSAVGAVGSLSAINDTRITYITGLNGSIDTAITGLSGFLKPQVDAVAVTAANNDLRIRGITGSGFGNTGMLQSSIQNAVGPLTGTSGQISTASLEVIGSTVLSGLVTLSGGTDLGASLNALAVSSATDDLRIRDITGYYGDTGMLQSSIENAVTGLSGVLRELIDANTASISGGGGGAGVLGRTSVNFSNSFFVNTGNLIDSSREYNYVDTGTLTGYDSFALNSVEVNTGCRLRIYNSLSYDDLLRPVSQDAPNNVGLITEVTLAANTPIEFTPSIVGAVSRLSDSGRNLMISISPNNSSSLGDITGKLDITKFT